MLSDVWNPNNGLPRRRYVWLTEVSNKLRSGGTKDGVKRSAGDQSLEMAIRDGPVRMLRLDFKVAMDMQEHEGGGRLTPRSGARPMSRQ